MVSRVRAIVGRRHPGHGPPRADAAVGDRAGRDEGAGPNRRRPRASCSHDARELEDAGLLLARARVGAGAHRDARHRERSRSRRSASAPDPAATARCSCGTTCSASTRVRRTALREALRRRRRRDPARPRRLRRRGALGRLPRRRARLQDRRRRAACLRGGARARRRSAGAADRGRDLAGHAPLDRLPIDSSAACATANASSGADRLPSPVESAKTTSPSRACGPAGSRAPARHGRARPASGTGRGRAAHRWRPRRAWCCQPRRVPAEAPRCRRCVRPVAAVDVAEGVVDDERRRPRAVGERVARRCPTPPGLTAPRLRRASRPSRPCRRRRVPRAGRRSPRRRGWRRGPHRHRGRPSGRRPPRSKRIAAGTIGTGRTPVAKPMPRSARRASRRRRRPARMPSRRPGRWHGCARPSAVGRRRSVSRVPGAEPRTSTPATVPSSGAEDDGAAGAGLGIGPVADPDARHVANGERHVGDAIRAGYAAATAAATAVSSSPACAAQDGVRAVVERRRLGVHDDEARRRRRASAPGAARPGRP